MSNCTPTCACKCNGNTCACKDKPRAAAAEVAEIRQMAGRP